MQQFESSSTNVYIVGENLLKAFYRLFYLQFCDSSENVTALCSKGFTSNLTYILHENNRNYNSYRFSSKFTFILFLFFLANQKQESRFQQVGGLIARNISVFCLQRVALYVKAMPNSTDFYKGIFLHVIPFRIIIP